MQGQAATRATDFIVSGHMHHIKIYCLIHAVNNFASANASSAARPTTTYISAADTAVPAHETGDAAAHGTADAATSPTADAATPTYSTATAQSNTAEPENKLPIITRHCYHLPQPHASNAYGSASVSQQTLHLDHSIVPCPQTSVKVATETSTHLNPLLSPFCIVDFSTRKLLANIPKAFSTTLPQHLTLANIDPSLFKF